MNISVQSNKKFTSDGYLKKLTSHHTRYGHHFLCILSFLFVWVSFQGCIEKKKTDHHSDTTGQSNNQTKGLNSDPTGELDPIADTNAQPGGTYTSWGSAYPKSLNYFLDNNSFSAEVTRLMFEPLVTLHPTENKAVGVLAKSWSISPDSLTHTFYLRPEAKWSDGTPITSTDFQSYYDIIMNPKHLTSVFRVGLSRFERPQIVDSLTFTIKAKEKHWMNFYEAGSMTAFPKVWEKIDFNSINDNFPVVSGPYRIKEIKVNRSITLERRNDWWGDALAFNRYKYNFQQIRYKFMEDRNKALEAFKKGEFDAYPVYTSSIWMMKTDFESIKKGWVAKQQVYNKEPKGFQGMAMNLRREKFKDIRVRKALCHLLNRELMNDKLMFNQYFLLNSYFPDLYPDLKNPSVPMYTYQPELARKLLQEAGYKPNQKGILEKNGSQLSIVFLTFSEDLRHLNIYLEDLKSVGINASIETLSLPTLRKRLDNADFDMYWIAWGASRLRDPESMWHSKYANQISTNNITGFTSPKADSLIEILKNTHDLNERERLLKILDIHLAEQVPYVLLWQSSFHRILYWNKFNTPVSVFSKFDREESIVTYWSINSQKETELQKAMKSGSSMDTLPAKVLYPE